MHRRELIQFQLRKLLLTVAGGIFYIRFQSSTACPNTAVLTLNLKSPKNLLNFRIRSFVPTIKSFGCRTWIHVLFMEYRSNNQTISAGPGTYYVDLGFNGCVYRQQVNVAAAQSDYFKNRCFRYYSYCICNRRNPSL
jgi:hypothetical protein